MFQEYPTLMPAANSTDVIANVIMQHAEESALLWSIRNRAAVEPHYDLLHLSALDERLECHLDGIRLAADQGWIVCEGELQRWQSSGETFSAALMAFERGQPGEIASVLEIALSSMENRKALISALAWLTDQQAAPHINRLLASSDDSLRTIGLAASAARRRDPGSALPAALQSPNTELRARALLAIGELGRMDLMSVANMALAAPQPAVQTAAAWSTVRLTTDSQALDILKAAAESYSPEDHRALELAMRRMKADEAAAWIEHLWQHEKLRRLAVIGVGIRGVPDFVPWLIDVMASPPLARLAGESFTMITGLDLTAARLDASCPAGFLSGPTEDPRDENVALDSDENLPWPDAAKLVAWWDRRRGDFAPHTRYLCGRPIAEEWLQHVLRHGYQRQRAAAALELALLNPDQPLFNVRAPGHRQQQWLSLK